MRNADRPRKTFAFTGWHMFGVMLLFFGTIVSVNGVMAWNAVTSWSGLVVRNSYVASQQFNGKVAEAEAFAASGITGAFVVGKGEIAYSLADADGRPIAADRVIATFKRPVDERDDFDVAFTSAGKGRFTVPVAIDPGQWIIDITAFNRGTRIFHQTARIVAGNNTLSGAASGAGQ